MKRFKIFPSLMMLAMGMCMLAVGVFCASPISVNITGELSILPHKIEVNSVNDYPTLEFYVTDSTAKTVSVQQNTSNKPTGDLVIPAMVSCNGVEYTVTSIAYSTSGTKLVSNLESTSKGNFSTVFALSPPGLDEEEPTGAFYSCTMLTSVIIPNTIKNIDNLAFMSCGNLASIDLPDGLTSIGEEAFRSCGNLTSIDLPDGLTSIGAYTFMSCTSLISIDLPEGLISIANFAFANCNALTAVDLPEGLTSLGSSVFLGCVNLTSVGLPSNLQTLSSSAFSSCTGLTSIDLPERLTSIGISAFEGCTGLTTITIPNNVVTISKSAFSGCTGLTAVSIGTGVQSIGDKAFYNCTALTKLYCNAVVQPTLGGTNVFYNCAFTLYIPEESVDAYKNSDWGAYITES